MSTLLKRGVFSAALSGIIFNTYTHTWLGDADIQSNEADFDGAGDAVTVPDNAAFEFAGGDFTVEAILTVDTEPQSFPGIIGKWGASPNIGWLLYWDVGTQTVRFLYSVNGTTFTSVIGSAVTLGVEIHVAVSRIGTNIRLFVGGTLDATSAVGAGVMHDNALNLTQGAFEDSLGVINGASYLDGKINYSRLSSIGRYSTSFTAPTTLTNDANTIYLNSWNGANGTTPTLNTE